MLYPYVSNDFNYHFSHTLQLWFVPQCSASAHKASCNMDPEYQIAESKAAPMYMIAERTMLPNFSSPPAIICIILAITHLLKLY
jgi:hypothetical protein